MSPVDTLSAYQSLAINDTQDPPTRSGWYSGHGRFTLRAECAGSWVVLRALLFLALLLINFLLCLLLLARWLYVVPSQVSRIGQPASVLAVIASHGESVEWLEQSPIPYYLVDKSMAASVGLDATSYLWFIITYYHQLPEWLLCMHNHEYHWHHAYNSQLRSMAIDLDAAGVGFLNINHGPSGQMLRFVKDVPAELSWVEHTQLRQELLGLRRPYGGVIAHPPCSQFWVRRERVLARPRAFFEELYSALSDAAHPLLSRMAAAEGYPSRPLHQFFAEAYWHVVFGEAEQYSLPFEMHDQIPLIPGLRLPPWRVPPLSTCLPPLTMSPAGFRDHLHHMIDPIGWGAAGLSATERGAKKRGSPIAAPGSRPDDTPCALGSGAGSMAVSWSGVLQNDCGAAAQAAVQLVVQVADR
jgi:hypothetical protein